jgi:hypothetical protein
MYRTVVTICTAQWSLYVPHSGHYMYHQFNIHNSTFYPHTVFMCFVWISEQTAIISLYSINWLVCITEMESVYCAVRTETNIFRLNLLLGAVSNFEVADEYVQIMLRTSLPSVSTDLPLFIRHIYGKVFKHKAHAVERTTPSFCANSLCR